MIDDLNLSLLCRHIHCIYKLVYLEILLILSLSFQIQIMTLYIAQHFFPSMAAPRYRGPRRHHFTTMACGGLGVNFGSRMGDPMAGSGEQIRKREQVLSVTTELYVSTHVY
jgi:hypothetical protein